eukprot:jgi/Ulvmu1/8764/UM048_0019.1
MAQCHLCMTTRSQRCSRFRVCGTHLTGSTSKDRQPATLSDTFRTSVLLYGWTRCSRCVANRPARSTAARARNVGGAEMLVGDALLLVVFCLYKQILAITTSPAFPGWLAPLHFNPVRFEELLGFMVTVTGTWVACSSILGDYRNSSQNMQQALMRACRTWLVSTPVMAAQLVLATAAENGSLVIDERFAEQLPLAASGVGEPFVSAAGILGIMAIWRTFYTGFMDWTFFLAYDATRADETPRDEGKAWIESITAVAVLIILCGSAAFAANYALNPLTEPLSLDKLIRSADL